LKNIDTIPTSRERFGINNYYEDFLKSDGNMFDYMKLEKLANFSTPKAFPQKEKNESIVQPSNFLTQNVPEKRVFAK
jgi:hypothetical protein